MLAPVSLVLLLSTSALAGSRGGGPPPGRGDATGRLGRVSGGIGEATGGPQKQTGTAPSPRDTDDADPDYQGMYHRRRDGADIIVLDNENRVIRRISPHEPNRLAARFDAYVGVQKVVESDSSISASVAVTDDWFRLAGYVSHYREDRMDGGGTLAMTLGGGTFGLPLQIGGRSAAIFEGGVALLRTSNDPTADSSLTGGKVGLHLEQGLGEATVIGDAHALLFDGVRAFEGRLAVRYGHVEAALRVLDFDVGPALYGPELGLAF